MIPSRSKIKYARLAQLVEHVIRNDGAGGSNPPAGTMFSFGFCQFWQKAEVTVFTFGFAPGVASKFPTNLSSSAVSAYFHTAKIVPESWPWSRFRRSRSQ
ncbi:hypothetical protein ATPR_2143 [Acetobacter tropicalis NBRC 101654]|uniref:Uncharacterized protein n=1 Tax=Acetobacter tropicalis NBRC 101654 TaxID=749388 RepID=F7VFJ4_9PROT|nr:hypothetical protein ATPR_2143 [Acetobacter tropicalis NBRC 101654]